MHLNVCSELCMILQFCGLNSVTLTILWYDNFGENQTPLQRNGMAAITKIASPPIEFCNMPFGQFLKVAKKVMLPNQNFGPDFKVAKFAINRQILLPIDICGGD